MYRKLAYKLKKCKYKDMVLQDFFSQLRLMFATSAAVHQIKFLFLCVLHCITRVLEKININKSRGVADSLTRRVGESTTLRLNEERSFHIQ
jgi:hypothetical protein